MIVAVMLLCPLAYVVGLFPSAHIVARRGGIDVTTSGSGNPGASNVGRLLGRRAGITVFALDAAKGAVPALVGAAVAGRGAGLVLGAAALLGHVFPLGRDRRGGKGVATAGGVCLGLYPVVAAIAIGSWVVLAKVTGKASLASLLATLSVPAGLIVMGRPWGEIAGVGAMALLIVVRHRANLRRLVRGDEIALSAAHRDT